MSPCLVGILTPEGLQRADYTPQSLEDAVQYEPLDGVYTITNTYNTYQVLKFDAHLDRLERSAALAGIPLKLDRQRLRQALRQLISEAGFGDVRFRITVPRQQPDRLIISLEPFSPPPSEIYSQGVRCVTIPNSARQNPAVKATSWMHRRRDIALPQGIYEGLLLSPDGAILEGRGSNFYAIRDGALYTATEGVLKGIAQQIVLEIAPPIIPVHKQPVSVADIPQLQEAFLTSSSRAIIPIVEIDGVTIGEGRRGAITQQLQQAYHKWVQAHLEAL